LVSLPEHPSSQQSAKMGRVRTKTVKRSAKVIIERYYPKLTLDFETNKRICDEIAIIASKRLRNKIGMLLNIQHPLKIHFTYKDMFI
jgi:ribosomal protein S17E